MRMSSVRTLTRRTNNASAAYFTDEAMEKPFQKGGLRYVAKGVYTDGPRRGQTCVCKWPKSGFVDSASPYEDDMRVVSKASEIIEKFNEAKIIDKIVVMNRPETWTLSGDEWDGKVVMLEPYISNYTKFNSNSVRHLDFCQTLVCILPRGAALHYVDERLFLHYAQPSSVFGF